MSETLSYKTVKPEEVTTWFEACEAADFPSDGGLNISYHGLQIAVFGVRIVVLKRQIGGNRVQI